MLGRSGYLPVMLALMAGGACGGSADSRSKPVDGPHDSPTAVRLAALQGHGRPVPTSLTRDFDDVLTALEVRCTETREISPSLAEIAVDAVARAHQGGHDISHLEALRTLESSTHEGADMKIDCSDAAKRLFAR